MQSTSDKPFDRLHNRVKHYLLDWKESHIGKFIQKYGVEAMLTNMSEDQLTEVFILASQIDKDELFKSNDQEEV